MTTALAELQAGLSDIERSPGDDGTLRLIVRRPAFEQREVVEVAHLHVDDGLVGDDWRVRGSRRTADGSADPAAQLTFMNARLMSLLAGPREAWAAAGDQLYVDLDLSVSNLPIGTRLTLGDALLKVSPKPHTGCAKFAARFGDDALRFVSTPSLRDLRLRGMYAVVVRSGDIRVGDRIRKA